MIGTIQMQRVENLDPEPLIYSSIEMLNVLMANIPQLGALTTAHS